LAQGVGSTGTAAPDSAALRAVHEHLLHDRTLQFDFTAASAPRPIHEPEWMKALGRFLAEALETALPVLKVVFWVGIGAAVLLVAWLILREVLGVRIGWARRAKAARQSPADWRPDTRRARALLENADRLAAQGRFDQAVRLILHRGIEDIGDRRPRLMRPALTAREIAELDAVPAGARGAFGRLAAIVEFSAFAGHPIGQPAFAQCREAYEAFVRPEAWV